MVYRVVSTKLTEEEHAKFLDFCNKKGISPFAFIKESIFDQMTKQEKEEENKIEKLDMKELKKALGI